MLSTWWLSGYFLPGKLHVCVVVATVRSRSRVDVGTTVVTVELQWLVVFFIAIMHSYVCHNISVVYVPSHTLK